MNELNLDKLQRIPIPEGLKQRLEDKIDQWAQNESDVQLSDKTRLPARRRMLRVLTAAAIIAVLVGAGIYTFAPREDSFGPDTFHDPALARVETEHAMQLLAKNISKGLEHVYNAEEIGRKAEQKLNTQLKKLE